MDEQQSIMNNFLDILTDGVHSLKQENNKGYERLNTWNRQPRSYLQAIQLAKGQHSVTGKGRFDNLLQHLSDPWHNTIVQTLSGGN
ncbi:hypothetical protein MTR_0003s0070 [Medicago truncatula]|uniref:Uncharacterized protein n=1 Tax=Medicago truncatula TaxID=3880 RepID=A0A072TJA7_MEDTR|nr:hypothetical protein MTR_0003s0070 [Medicago truncatula]